MTGCCWPGARATACMGRTASRGAGALSSGGGGFGRGGSQGLTSSRAETRFKACWRSSNSATARVPPPRPSHYISTAPTASSSSSPLAYSAVAVVPNGLLAAITPLLVALRLRAPASESGRSISDSTHVTRRTRAHGAADRNACLKRPATGDRLSRAHPQRPCGHTSLCAGHVQRSPTTAALRRVHLQWLRSQQLHERKPARQLHV